MSISRYESGISIKVEQSQQIAIKHINETFA